jgi:hypothetical protein
MRFVNLEKYRLSPFGKYVRQQLTRPVEMIRFAGYALDGRGRVVSRRLAYPDRTAGHSARLPALGGVPVRAIEDGANESRRAIRQRFPRTAAPSTATALCFGNHATV